MKQNEEEAAVWRIANANSRLQNQAADCSRSWLQRLGVFLDVLSSQNDVSFNETIIY